METFATGGFLREPLSEHPNFRQEAAAGDSLASVKSTVPPSPPVPSGLPPVVDDDDDDVDIPDSNVLLAVKMAVAHFPQKRVSPKCPPFALLTQILAYLHAPGHMEVEKQLFSLLNAREIVMFKLANSSRDLAAVLITDYLQALSRLQHALAQQGPSTRAAVGTVHVFASVMAEKPIQVEIAEAELRALLLTRAAKSGVGFKEQDWPVMLNGLLSHGLLMWRRGAGEPSLRLAVPSAGAVVTAVELARTEIVAYLKRRKHKEAVDKALMTVKLRHSNLGWPFHLSDLKGRGTVEAIRRGHNTVLRLRRP